MERSEFNHCPRAAAGLAWLRRRGGPRPCLAIALVAIATLAPLVTSWHEATVQHVRCAEHGELTHVAAVVATVPMADARPGRATPSAFDREQTGTPAGHDHC